MCGIWVQIVLAQLGHQIDTGWAEWAAAKKSLGGEPQAPPRPVERNGLMSVRRTRRVKPTRRQPMRKRALVRLDQTQHQSLDSREISAAIDAIACAKLSNECSLVADVVPIRNSPLGSEP